MNAHLPHGRKDCARSVMELSNHVGVDLLIESSFFESRSNDDSAITAWNEIDFGRADHVVQHGGPRFRMTQRDYAQHLSFDRTRRNSVGADLAGPCSCAVHNHVRMIGSLTRRYREGRSFILLDCFDGGSAGDVSATMLQRAQKSGAEQAGIHPSFGKAVRVCTRDHAGLESCDV
jgi:hypothetical protein